ncbi:hypothetical protein HY623_02730 [Candidatus Uhrbacteria bacterium]|nr:hypothetical protein [Candidatus Uhrbacteria bacterium]
MIHRVILTLGIAVFLGFLAGIPVPGLAFGISPGSVVEERVPTNFKLPRKFIVTRGNPSEDEQAKITVSGPASQYIELPKGDVIELPKGARAVDVPFTINTTSLGAETYRAELTATTSQKESGEETEGYGSRVVSGATGLIRFTVVNDEIEQYTIDTVYVQESEIETQIGFSFRLSNKGTVFARPEKIELAFLENESGKEAYRETIDTAQIVAIAPLATGRVDVITKATALPPGNYRGEFTFYNNEEVVTTDKSVIFRVFPQGALSQQGELVSLATEKGTYEPGESVKITGSFKNSGDVGLIAQLNLEIFIGSKRIETLTSKEVFVPKLETVDFDLFYEQEEGGEYTVKGIVTYGSKKSNAIETTFKIKQFPLVLAIGAGVLLLGIVVFVLWMFKRRRSIKNSAPKASPQQPASMVDKNMV